LVVQHGSTHESPIERTAVATTAPPFSSEIEGGLLAVADQLLGDEHDRASAQRLADAAELLEEAKQAKNDTVGRLEEIGRIYPTSTGADRKTLNAERIALAGEISFAPADIATLAQHYAEALIAYCVPVHHAAKGHAVRMNVKEIFPLEGRQHKVREDGEQAKGVDRATATDLRESGIAVDQAEVGVGEEKRSTSSKTFTQLGEQLDELRKQRDVYADLSNSAQRALTRKFGEGGYEGLYSTPGVLQWQEALRHRVAAQCAPFTGGANLKPIGA
jgi:hypothetical protein